MTVFAALCRVCGLSQREAAAYLDARLDTVKSWSSGRNNAPDGVLDELAALADRIDAAADEAVAAIESASPPPGPVTPGFSVDDREAQDAGWPCAGAQNAALALTVARGMAAGYRFRLTPRGTDAATALAIEAHKRSPDPDIS